MVSPMRDLESVRLLQSHQYLNSSFFKLCKWLLVPAGVIGLEHSAAKGICGWNRCNALTGFLDLGGTMCYYVWLYMRLGVPMTTVHKCVYTPHWISQGGERCLTLPAQHKICIFRPQMQTEIDRHTEYTEYWWHKNQNMNNSKPYIPCPFRNN